MRDVGREDIDISGWCLDQDPAEHFRKWSGTTPGVAPGWVGQGPAARDHAMVPLLYIAVAARRWVVAVPDVLEATTLQCPGDSGCAIRTDLLKGDDVRFRRSNRVCDGFDSLRRAELANVPGEQMHGEDLGFKRDWDQISSTAS